MSEQEKIDIEIADALMERPYGFNVGHRHFFIYPPSLGKMNLLGRLMEPLGVNPENIKTNPYAEMLRVTSEHRADVSRIISYHTARTKQEVLNNSLMTNRAEFMNANLDVEEMATLLMTVMGNDKYSIFSERLGLDKEQERYDRVRKVKDTKNVYTFGGKSIYGTLIDFACERYGWTLDYVVWGISYVNLRLLMADSVKSLTLTDDERKKVRLDSGESVINADDKANIEKILSMDWS